MKAIGISRDAENPKVLCVYFDAEPSDDDMRVLHEMLADRHVTQPKAYLTALNATHNRLHFKRPDEGVTEALFSELVVEELANMVRRLKTRCSNHELHAEATQLLIRLGLNGTQGQCVANRELLKKVCSVLENSMFEFVDTGEQARELAAELRKSL